MTRAEVSVTFAHQAKRMHMLAALSHRVYQNILKRYNAKEESFQNRDII